jgi:PKD repeat protein
MSFQCRSIATFASRRLRLLLSVVTVAASGLAGACDKVPLTAPTGSTITVYSSTSYVPVNGTAEITATVIEQAGTAVQNGTTISFTTSLGVVDPLEARTRDGKVTVRFVAGTQSGTARITAFSGAATSGGSSGGSSGSGGTSTGGTGSASVEIKIGGAAATRLVLSATPGTVPSTGGAVQLLATVLDADGNRIPGVPVSFTTTAGTLSSASVNTDGNGEARTVLTTSRRATVTATAGTVTPQSLTIEIATAPTVRITPPTTAVAGQPAVFTLSVSSGSNGAPVRDVTVDFGDGQRLSLGSDPTSVAHVYTEAGTYTVTATATDTAGEKSSTSAVIVVRAASPLTVRIQGDTQPRANAPASFTVTVTPADAQVVSYQFDFGDGQTATVNSPQITHVYTTAGPRTLSVTVVTADGQRGFAQLELVVRAAIDGN